MKSHFLVFFSITVAFGLTATSGFAAQPQTASHSAATQPDNYKVCKSEYALCTVAPCYTVPGHKQQLTCSCTVEKGYSAGGKACQGVKQTPAGQEIASRYYPVKSYAICSNHRVWANCFDAPCIVNKNNPSAATCNCKAVKGQGDYVIPTARYTPNTCTTGIYSSATVQGVTQLTNFLKGTTTLVPYPIRVLTGQTKGSK